MSKTNLHVQCKFRKGNRETTGWVPKKPNLKVGAVVDLQINGVGEFQPGWEVLEMWAEKPSDMVKARERDFLKHRHGTDARRTRDGGWDMPDK